MRVEYPFRANYFTRVTTSMVAGKFLSGSQDVLDYWVAYKNGEKTVVVLDELRDKGLYSIILRGEIK